MDLPKVSFSSQIRDQGPKLPSHLPVGFGSPFKEASSGFYNILSIAFQILRGQVPNPRDRRQRSDICVQWIDDPHLGPDVIGQRTDVHSHQRRLVRKKGLDGFAEMVFEPTPICLMGYFNEAVNRLFVNQVRVPPRCMKIVACVRVLIRGPKCE
jgi:hypothetical protein